MTESGKKYENAIKVFIENGNVDSLKESFSNFVTELEQSDIPYDLDDTLFLHTIEIAIKNGYSAKQMQSDYLGNLRAINTDKMIDSIMNQRNIFAGYVVENHAPICYLDQNVFTPYIRGQEIGHSIPENFIIPYSPAHIIEIGQTRDTSIIDEELTLTWKKTDGLEILFRENSFVIFKEHPKTCYLRAYDETGDVLLAKEAKMLADRIEDVRFEGYRTNKLRDIYNSQDPDHFLINHRDLVDEILMKIAARYDLKYIEENGNCNDYHVINGFIHNLYMVMDICGFKKDNKEQKIRSSRIDIEHLLYGAVSNLFLTHDERLRVRARNIYGVLGKQIDCPDF